MPAQSIHAATGATNVPEQELQHRRGPNGLRARSVLSPANGVNDRSDFLHVSIFADGREQVGSFQELIFRNTGDAFDHLGRVSRVLLFEQLENAPRMLQ